MDRTAATAFLTEYYRELTGDVKFTEEQTQAAYDGIIDNALLYLGYDASVWATADVPQADLIKYRLLLTYFALKRFITIYATRFDVTIEGALGAKRSQAYDRLKDMLAGIEAELAGLGISVGNSTPGYSMGYINLDFLTPSCSSEF
jgi:hypothetical protein